MSRWNTRAAFYRRALSYFRPESRWIIALVALIGVQTALGLAQVWPMAILIDSVLSPRPHPGWFEQWLLLPLAENRVAQLALLAAATLVLRIMQESLGLARSMVNLVISNNATLRIRCHLFQKLQALSLQFHFSQSQGDTIYRLNNDTCGIQTILNVLVNTSVSAVTLAVMLGIMLSRSVSLTLLSLAVIPLLWTTNKLFERTMKIRSLEAKEIDSRFTTVVQRSLSAMMLVQAFGREADELGRFRSTVASSLTAWWHFHWQWACYRLVVGTLFGAGGALIFGYGGWLVYRDQFLNHANDGMTIGDLVIFITYLGMFYDPLCKLTGAGASMLEGITGTERVFELLDRDPVIEDAPDAIELPQRPRVLTLSKVSFSYNANDQILRGIDAAIHPGQMVAFVGSSGVGKSTLLNLLPRFYNPTEGSIELDGHDLRAIKLRSLRKHIALVLQKGIILPTTVAENIAYGRPDATEAEIRRAAELAGAGEFINALPGGYDFQIAEEGENLSGGQRQRIAIARALLTEAPIIVLDEPTSALDAHHEQLVTQTLAALRGLRTIVLVSHRLSTVIDCDQIFVMDGGRVVERGTHAQLIRRRGPYYSMAAHQLQLRDQPPELVGAA